MSKENSKVNNPDKALVCRGGRAEGDQEMIPRCQKDAESFTEHSSMYVCICTSTKIPVFAPLIRYAEVAR